MDAFLRTSFPLNGGGPAWAGPGPGAPRIGFGPEGVLWHWGYLQASMGF